MPRDKSREEFELIPVSPIRRLERRIDQLESGGMDPKGFLKEIIDIIKMNQQLVDELAKANDALRIEISRLPSRLEDVTDNLKELISYIKASAAEEGAPGPSFKPLVDKMDKLIEANTKIVESSQSMLSVLEDIGSKLKRRPLIPVRKLPPKMLTKPIPK